jgi:hypothetical protein
MMTLLMNAHLIGSKDIKVGDSIHVGRIAVQSIGALLCLVSRNAFWVIK